MAAVEKGNVTGRSRAVVLTATTAVGVKVAVTVTVDQQRWRRDGVAGTTMSVGTRIVVTGEERTVFWPWYKLEYYKMKRMSERKRLIEEEGRKEGGRDDTQHYYLISELSGN